MRPTFPVGLALGETRVITAFLAAVGLLWAGSLLHGPWVVWTSAGVAAVVVLPILVTWRRAPLATLLGRRLGRRAQLADELVSVPEARDHRLRWTDGHAAIRAADDELIAVVAIDGPSHTPSVLDNHRVQSATTLPVGVVAEALRQFDVTLTGIDILSVGQRRAPKTHHYSAHAYSGLVGDHGAVGRRRSVCVLRMNSLDNVAAVACRDSVAATLDACAQRLAAELTARHLPARVVDAAELADIDAALAGGVAQNPRPRWGGLRHAGGWVCTYWVSPRDITTETLDRVWAPDTDHTATAVQLRPSPNGGVAVGMLVRYATPGPQKHAPITGLNPLSGRHDLGLRAGLADARSPAVQAPARVLGDGEDLRAAIGASGLIVGATPQGHPLLVDLADAAPAEASTVTVAGELALLVQLAMRSAAIGYQVLVCTGRAEAWREATAAGLRVVSRLPAQLPDDGRGVMVVYDRVDAPAPRASITMRAVAAGTASVADVHFEQDSARTAVIRTAEFQYRIHVNLDQERNMIKWRPRRVA
jgi:type VII secretion protein EccE